MEQQDKFIEPKDNECLCCGKKILLTWTDTHGVGVCINCGLPYRVYFYENDKRVERPIATAMNKHGLYMARRYWKDRHERVFPALFSFMPADRPSYCGATQDECYRFEKWMSEQEDVNNAP